MIPEWNITPDNVLAMRIKNPEGKIDYDEASWLLGSYDKRTIRRHYNLINEILPKAIIVLVEYGGAIPTFASLPASEPGHDLYELLESHIYMLI